MTIKEIETKILSLLEIKRIRKGLTKEEAGSHKHLSIKHRTKTGRLRSGSFYVNSLGKWAIVS